VTNAHGSCTLLIVQNSTLFVLLKRSIFFSFNPLSSELLHPSPPVGGEGTGMRLLQMGFPFHQILSKTSGYQNGFTFLKGETFNPPAPAAALRDV